MTTADQIATAVEAGATIDEAARATDVNPHTLRRWLTDGRKDPEGKHGALAARVDTAREGRKQAEQALEGVTLAEAEAVLAAAVRKGSIPALKLWFDRHDRQQGPAEDELTWLDPK
jgi:transposase-like protein